MTSTVLGHRSEGVRSEGVRSEGVASSPFGVLSPAWLFMDPSTSFRSSGVIVRNASRCL
jgi:hypothetical protein